MKTMTMMTIITTTNQWRIYERPSPPPPVQFSSFSCSFRQKFGQIVGKSYIRRCKWIFNFNLKARKFERIKNTTYFMDLTRLMLNLRLPLRFLGNSTTSSCYTQSPPELSNASDTEMLKWRLSRIKYLIALSGLITWTFFKLHLGCICTFIPFSLTMLI